jgi:hypothetical protein
MSVRFAILKKQLDVPLPIYLSGYFNRKDPATECHDPLNISCFYVEDSKKAVAVFGLDLLGIYYGVYDKLVKAIEEKINRADLQIILSCAHTHSAPGYHELLSEGKTINLDVLFDEIVGKAVSILEEIPALAQPAVLHYSERPLSGVGANRRNKDIEVNTVLRTLSFDFADKQAVVVNYPCHPTHLSYRNLLISKDYQGAAMDELVEQGYLPMFLQGACGDISTRFTRHEQSFDDMARIAHIFASAIKEQLPGESFEVTDFDYSQHVIEIKAKEYQDEEFYLSEIERYTNELEAARDKLPASELRILETALEGINVEYRYSQYQDLIVTKVRCGILSLGDKLALVFLPFELFSKIADQIFAGSKVPYTMIVCYTFDGLGYLPDQASFDQAGYEVLSCTYEKGSGELVGEKVIELLNQ